MVKHQPEADAAQEIKEGQQPQQSVLDTQLQIQIVGVDPDFLLDDLVVTHLPLMLLQHA